MESHAVRKTYHLREMREGDLPRAHHLTTLLKWPHTLNDWRMMYELSDTIVLDGEDDVIGTACAVHQGDYASIGLIVVADEYQGQGLGRRLMMEIMNRADGKHLFLTATEAGKPLYIKLGFAETAKIEQYQAVVPDSISNADRVFTEGTIRPMETGEAENLSRLMNHASAMNRDSVAEFLLSIAKNVMVLEKQGEIVGISVCRPFGHGLSIGPVIAQNAEQANALIYTQLNQCVGVFVRIDVLQHFHLGETLSGWGLDKVDCVSMMVKGTPPAPDPGFSQFSLVTQAIG
jgi:GNAT superfamily N-acetyltransferase